MLRHRQHTVINVAGLALGLSATVLIFAFVSHQTNYDRHHEHSDHIFRVAVERTQPDESIRSATTPRPLASALEAGIPDVVRAARISRERAEQVLIRHGEIAYFEDKFLFADASMFDVFTVPFIRGTASTALANPFSAVLTENAAKKTFGSVDPIGKTISVRLRGDGDVFDYEVTGIIRDVPPASHFDFDFLATYNGHPNVGDDEDQSNWIGLNVYTYIRLRPGADAARAEELVAAVAYPYLKEQVESDLGVSIEEYAAAGHRFDYFLQPLERIHLHSDLRNEIGSTGNFTQVVLFAVVAVFILGLACINFTHMAAAQAVARRKEVGVRQTLGARRSDLIRQMLVESIALATVATAIGVALAWISVPLLESITSRAVAAESFFNIRTILLLAAAPLIVGTAAGLAPALYVSATNPSSALRGGGWSATARRRTLRPALVAFQFAVSGILIICTLVMERQMQFLGEASLGFDKESVVVIEGTEVLSSRMSAFQERLRRINGVTNVSNAEAMPGSSLARTTIRASDAGGSSGHDVLSLTAGFGYATTLGLEVIAGRDFRRNFSSDSMAVILNESAARVLGWMSPRANSGRVRSHDRFASDQPTGSDSAVNGVGRAIIAENREYRVIGVVSDYHFASLRQAIEPLVIFGPDPWNQARPNLVVPVRLEAASVAQSLDALEDAWQAFAPAQPFVYTFLDEDFGRQYLSDRRTRTLFRIFSALAVFIAGLGLYALASFRAMRRTKEIGVRKVLGASTTRITMTLSKEFAVVVGIGTAAAVPVAYIISSRWLDGFAYRISVSPDILVAGTVLLFTLALIPVGFHVLRAAIADPVTNLRYE